MNIFRFATATVALFWIFVVAWVLSVSNLLPPAVVWTGGGFLKEEVHAGESVEVLREIDVQRDVTVNISRSIVRKEGNKTYVQSLPPFRMVYTAGQYNQIRSWVIPADLTPSVYTLENRACYFELRIFERCVDIPPLTITVIAK